MDDYQETGKLRGIKQSRLGKKETSNMIYFMSAMPISFFKFD